MTTLLQLSTNLSPFDNSIKKPSIFGSNSFQPINFHTLPSQKINAFDISGLKSSLPISYFGVSRPKIGCLCRDKFKLGTARGKWSFLEVSRSKDGTLVRGEKWKSGKKRVVLMRFNEFGLNSNGGGGGGGGDNSKVLGNLVLAIILTYLTLNGQLGWIFDAIVSIWLLAVIVPIVGLGAFLWWARRDIIQSSCPNCGNEVQVFKSTLNDEIQLCPYCTQPFSVAGDKFVRDPVKFSNQTTQFPSRSAKVKDSSVGIVDVEAEIRDAD